MYKKSFIFSLNSVLHFFGGTLEVRCPDLHCCDIFFRKDCRDSSSQHPRTHAARPASPPAKQHQPSLEVKKERSGVPSVHVCDSGFWIAENYEMSGVCVYSSNVQFQHEESSARPKCSNSSSPSSPSSSSAKVRSLHAHSNCIALTFPHC